MAGARPTRASLIEEATREELWNHPFWRGLLHIPPGEQRSKIISPEFFLAADGALAPRAELLATIEALSAPATALPNEHARCRFPARYLWLKSRLDWPPGTGGEPACPDFSRWENGGRIRAVSLVFATGYLRNPASFYGHILLRFNSGEESPLLDTSLNYGAIFDTQDIAPVYVFKGLTGRYEAGFTHERFYKKNHEYGELELRDLWEYELDLDAEELALIIAHSWELLGRKFRYYFVHDNCATEMAELVELIIGERLRDPLFPWVVPSLIFSNLEALAQDGRSRVKRVVYHPSRQSRLHGRYTRLAPQTRALVKRQAATPPGDLSSSIEQLATQDSEVIDTLLDFYQIRTLQHPDDTAYKRAHQQLLVKRISLPAIDDPPFDYAASPPHLGQRPTTIRGGTFHHSDLGDGVHLRFRPVFFDLLSLDSSLPGNAELSLLDLALDYYRRDRHVRLSHLEIFRATTLNVSKTALHDEEGWAWSFRLAVEPSDLTCSDCLVPRFVGGLGKAFRAGNETLLYLMGDLQLEESYRRSGSVVLAPRAGAIVAVSPAWKMHLEVGGRESLDGDRDGGARWRWENRFGVGRNWDLRMLYEHAEATRWTTTLSLYF